MGIITSWSIMGILVWSPDQTHGHNCLGTRFLYTLDKLKSQKFLEGTCYAAIQWSLKILDTKKKRRSIINRIIGNQSIKGYS